MDLWRDRKAPKEEVLIRFYRFDEKLSGKNTEVYNGD